MDFLHSIMVCIANWSTLVDRFGVDPKGMDYITWYVHDCPRQYYSNFNFWRDVGALRLPSLSMCVAVLFTYD